MDTRHPSLSCRRSRSRRPLPTAALAVVLALSACGAEEEQQQDERALRPVSLAEARPAQESLQPTEALAMEDGVVRVYKSPTCGCCTAWVDHLREEGFEVRVEDGREVTAAKVELGVPPGVQSCHTAVVDGYVVEGHVPADAIRDLLSERPDVSGVAVPGMPVGSPGMEVEDGRQDPYDILTFDDGGATEVFDSR